MSGRRRRSLATVLLGALLAGACGGDETADRFRDSIAERAADPAHALTTTVPGRPGDLDVVLDDPYVSFHTGAGVTDAQFETVQRAVLAVRIDMELTEPLDVFIGTEPELVGLDSIPETAVVVDAVTLTGEGATEVGLFVAAARSTALVAQDGLMRNSILPGESTADGASLFERPQWLAEGQAELVAWQLARTHGELDGEWDERRRAIVELAASSDLPLEAFEVVPADADPGVSRVLAYLAAELLASDVAPEALHRHLWPAIAAEGWEAAFGSTFAMSVEEFYAEFGAWRADGFPGG